MAYQKLVTLADRLLKRTDSGELSWEETVEEGAFQTAFPGYVVKVMSVPDRSSEGMNKITLRIYDEDNVLIEELDEADLASYYDGHGPGLDTLDALYSKARRVAKGVEEALDTILEALGDDPEPPAPESDDDSSYGPPGDDDIPF